MSLSCRNQFIDLLCKSMVWFLYDRSLRHKRVKPTSLQHCKVITFRQTKNASSKFVLTMTQHKNENKYDYVWQITLKIQHWVKILKIQFRLLVQKPKPCKCNSHTRKTCFG